MDFQQAADKLQLIQQRHLLNYWHQSDAIQQQYLLNQIAALDIEAFKRQQQQLRTEAKKQSESFSRFDNFFLSGNQQDFKAGNRLIAEGKVGCLIMAGGQGSRLRFDGPKGMFPISIIKHKTLFQLFAEKVFAAGKQVDRLLPMAIMTSPLNHETVVDFFQRERFFGLDPMQIDFYCQRNIPLLNTTGNLFLEDLCKIAEGPDGNGYALRYFYESGLWDKWWERGVRYLNYVLIDNPLADPFDSELCGLHERQKVSITLKCTQRKHAEEKVGVLVSKDGKTRVLEYTEMPIEERKATLPSGELKHLCANLSLFCFSMDFIRETANCVLPGHIAFKAVKYLTTTGQTTLAETPNAFKYEYFIFDLLPLAERVCALLYPRESCFAPLKNFAGEDSVETTRCLLQNRDHQIFSQMTGTIPPKRPFELSQQFYYPTPELLSKWREKPLPEDDYIEDN